MANANKNLVKKTYDEIKNAIKKTRAKQKRENIILDIIFPIGILAYLIIFTLIAIVNKSNSYGFVLTVCSLIVTFCFEGYEWVYLFKENKEKKHSLMPCQLSGALFMFFLIIILCLPNKMSTFENFDNNNLLCAVSVFIYVLLVTIRKIIEDLKA